MSITITEIATDGTKHHLSLSEALSKYGHTPVATTGDYPASDNSDAQPDPPHPEKPPFYMGLPKLQRRR